MLDHVRSTTFTPFCAPRFLIARWEKEERQLSFGGFKVTVGPVTEDALRDERAWRAICPVEGALHQAVAKIRETVTWEVDPDRWTQSLDGWGSPVQGGWQGFDEPPPTHVVDLIARAYPLPRSFREALDEMTYWAWRVTMALMCLGYGETPFGAVSDPYGGDPGLDLTVVIRLELLRPLVLHELPATAFDDIITRLQIYGEMDRKDLLVEAALARDIAEVSQLISAAASLAKEMLADLRAQQAPKAPTKRGGSRKRELRDDDPIVAMLLTKPYRSSDHIIAKAHNVVVTTVGNKRRQLIAEDRIDPKAPFLCMRANGETYLMNPREPREPGVRRKKTGGRKKAPSAPLIVEAVTSEGPPRTNAVTTTTLPTSCQTSDEVGSSLAPSPSRSRTEKTSAAARLPDVQYNLLDRL